MIAKMVVHETERCRAAVHAPIMTMSPQSPRRERRTIVSDGILRVSDPKGAAHDVPVTPNVVPELHIVIGILPSAKVTYMDGSISQVDGIPRPSKGLPPLITGAIHPEFSVGHIRSAEVFAEPRADKHHARV